MLTNIGRMDFSTFTFFTFAQAYHTVLNYMSLEADLLTNYLIDVVVKREYYFGKKIKPSCINTVQSALKVHLNVPPSSHCSAACLFFGGASLVIRKNGYLGQRCTLPLRSLHPELVSAGSLG